MELAKQRNAPTFPLFWLCFGHSCGVRERGVFNPVGNSKGPCVREVRVSAMTIRFEVLLPAAALPLTWDSPLLAACDEIKQELIPIYMSAAKRLDTRPAGLQERAHSV
jgi:hypothetical protein